MGRIGESGVEEWGIDAIVGGSGGLGHLGCSLRRRWSCSLLLSTPVMKDFQLAEVCGADTVVDARQEKEKAVEEVKKVRGDQGADATLNVSDDRTAAALAAAIEATTANTATIQALCPLLRVRGLFLR